MAKILSEVGKQPRRRAPAATPEEREQQLIALTIDCVERQLMEGTASSQVMTHFLKLATSKNRLEEEKLRSENEVLKRKALAFDQQESTEKLFKEAMDAMRSYKGANAEDD